MTLNSDHETYLCVLFNSMIFIVNYPYQIKPFYMKKNIDKKTVSNFDLLAPEIGELMGGSAREDDFNGLKKRLEMQDKSNKLGWYLNIRKYGYVHTAGFGLGIERLLMFLTGIENIKDVVSYPRFHGTLLI